MFTNADTIDLLTAIAAYDGRAPSEAAVIAWREAGDRAHWSLPEALDAVHSYFAESTAWIMPAHVTAIIRAERRNAPRRLDGTTADDAATDETRTGALARIRAIIGHVGPGGAEADPALDVSCEWCGSTIGERCTVPRKAGRRTMRDRACHPSRLVKALHFRAGQDPNP
jgi:hypothetical protein